MKNAILIVDDEVDMCWAMEHILKSQGQPIVTATSGAEACARLSEGYYSLVFLDAKIPDMDGLDIARFAIKLPNYKPQIVMISGYHYANDPIVLHAIEDGLIVKFLAKPFTNDEILSLFHAYWKNMDLKQT